jgi:hypothetical protein
MGTHKLCVPIYKLYLQKSKDVALSCLMYELYIYYVKQDNPNLRKIMITKRFVIVSLLLVFIACACTPPTEPELLTKTAEEEEMIVLPSGLKYQVIKEGTGAKPGLRDTVTMNYHGTLVDGTVYHSSYERGKPVTIQVNRLIKGWSEALTLMQEGSEWKLFIPPELAYGEKGSGQVIGPNETLILDVVLIKVH